MSELSEDDSLADGVQARRAAACADPPALAPVAAVQLVPEPSDLQQLRLRASRGRPRRIRCPTICLHITESRLSRTTIN